MQRLDHSVDRLGRRIESDPGRLACRGGAETELDQVEAEVLSVDAGNPGHGRSAGDGMGG